jgi:hypothetical protein
MFLNINPFQKEVSRIYFPPTWPNMVISVMPQHNHNKNHPPSVQTRFRFRIPTLSWTYLNILIYNIRKLKERYMLISQHSMTFITCPQGIHCKSHTSISLVLRCTTCAEIYVYRRKGKQKVFIPCASIMIPRQSFISLVVRPQLVF